MKKFIPGIILLFLLFNFQAFSQEEKTEAIFDQPLLITSAGQSAEVQLASILAKRAGLTYTLSKIATENDLGNMKTLVLVFGASMKGLGAAGLDVTKEKERIKKLIDEAKKKGISILGLHLGGESRRGKLTDELINDFLPGAKMAIVVKSGNKDGIFTSICQEHDIPLVEVEKTVSALEPFRKSFKN